VLNDKVNFDEGEQTERIEVENFETFGSVVKIFMVDQSVANFETDISILPK
jgi:hypothetical protein